MIACRLDFKISDFKVPYFVAKSIGKLHFKIRKLVCKLSLALLSSGFNHSLWLQTGLRVTKRRICDEFARI